MTAPENNSAPRKYRWPWVVLGFVVLGIALAVFWVALAAKKVAQQRETGEPIPTQSPAR
jgi:F0F1-type ATP synthase assembly protein I